MFKRNIFYEKAITTLYENIRGSDYGTKYSWKDLQKLAGLENKQVDIECIYYIANKVCLLMMQSDQRFLMTVPSFGKRIINPVEHSAVAKKKVKHIAMGYRDVGKVIASTNMDMLSQEQKNQVVEDANRYSTLEMFANEMLKKKSVGIVKKNDVLTAGLFLDVIKMFQKQEKK